MSLVAAWFLAMAWSIIIPVAICFFVSEYRREKRKAREPRLKASLCIVESTNRGDFYGVRLFGHNFPLSGPVNLELWRPNSRTYESAEAQRAVANAIVEAINREG